MGDTRPVRTDQPPVEVLNAGGRGPLVLLCDHASNRIPPGYGTLGLTAADMERHIAWDPGALPVARAMTERLDATLVASSVSRLIVDVNRPLDAPDLIPTLSETTAVPGNRDLPPAERIRRIALSHEPFHRAVEEVIGARLAAGGECAVVAIHSFTPVYKGVARPWHVGVIHDDDQCMSRPLIEALTSLPGVVVGDNEPYSPADRVYYSIERHARSRGLPCVMIEIRNDEIADAAGQRRWADRLTAIFSGLDLAIAAKADAG